MESKKIIVTPVNNTVNNTFSAECEKFSEITRSKPGYNRIKKEVLMEMRVKHHMTNAEIAKACGICAATVIKHIGCQPKEYTHNTLQKAGKIKQVNTAYLHEQKFASEQDAIMMHPKARSFECRMCGRKFYSHAKMHTVKFCSVCHAKRINMRNRGMTTAQIDAQIENKRKAQQILALIQQATEIASTMTDKSILPFPTNIK